MRIIAIDPGEVHCGVAFYDDTGFVDDGTLEVAWTAGEMTPERLFEVVCAETRKHQDSLTVVIEEFRLYPHMAQAQSWSGMKTVEVIGVVRYLCEMSGSRLVEQPATIKHVAERQMRARGVANAAVTARAGGHAKDAVLHGWYYLNVPAC